MNSPQVRHFDMAAIRQRLPGIPQLLRWLGVVSLTGAFAAFLFQEWQGGNDLFRYLMLLGLTLSLAIGGVVNGIWLREQKGARTFLAMALASLPVNFAILGAFLYQHFGIDGRLPDYPQVAFWQVDSAATALILFGLALPLLAATAHFAFNVHARGSARKLSLVYLSANLMIALPTRSPELSGVLALGMILALVFWLPRMLKATPISGTFEGRIAIMVLFLPAALLIGRSLWLYAANDLFLLLSVLAGHVVLRSIATYLEQGGWGRRILDGISLASAVCVSGALIDVLDSNPETVLLLGSPATAALFYQIGLKRTAGAIVLAGLCIDMLLFDGLPHGMAGLAAGAGLTAWGVRHQHKAPFVYGVLLTLFSLLRQLYLAIESFSFDSWGALALIGIAAVIAASLLERHGGRFVQLRHRLEGWS